MGYFQGRHVGHQAGRDTYMADSDELISVERTSVETMLTVLQRLRGVFNPDLALLKESAPGIASFCERLESGAGKLQAVLDNNSGASIALPREVVENMVARFKRFRTNFNPDSEALQATAPGVAGFTRRLEAAAETLEAALR